MTINVNILVNICRLIAVEKKRFTTQHVVVNVMQISQDSIASYMTPAFILHYVIIPFP